MPFGAKQTITLTRPVVDANGRVTTSPHSLHVVIPKGIIEGQRIRLEGQGLPGYGGSPAGDLYLEIAFQEDRLFHAEKRDIHLTLPIAPWEAALGATLTVPTLGGNVQLKIPPGSQGGKKLRLKGKGLVLRQPSGRPDRHPAYCRTRGQNRGTAPAVPDHGGKNAVQSAFRTGNLR
jgi:curved DNA-binding protein